MASIDCVITASSVVGDQTGLVQGGCFKRYAREANFESLPAQDSYGVHTATGGEPTIHVASRLEASGVRVEGRGTGAAIILASDVTFKAGQADLSKQAMATLGRVAVALMSTPGVQGIRVEGHTDSDPIRKSGWASNEALSQARAENVRKFLVKNGLDQSTVTVMGYGAARPVFPNDTAAHKANNRRVEIVIDAR